MLKNDIVSLRAPEPEDLALLYIWENDPEVWLVSNTLAPFSRFELKGYLESTKRDLYEARQLRLMIDLTRCEPSKTVGTIDLFDFEPLHNRAGVGILIADSADRGKGYASAALDLLIYYVFNHLSLHQLFCNISVDNKKSLTLFENKGFVITGEKTDWLWENNEWKNEYILQLLNKIKK